MVSAASEQALGVNFDTLDFRPYLGLAYLSGDTWTITISPVSLPGHTLTLNGTFSYTDAGQLYAGTVTRFSLAAPSGGFEVSTPGIDVIQIFLNVQSLSPDAFLSFLFSGPSGIQASAYGDLVRGFAGADNINLKGGDDTAFGGQANDVLWGMAGQDYLRGDEGDDQINGGDDFDDLHGNMGNDTVSGEGGDDWVVGGKDNDWLDGDAGNDIVYGNIGVDQCYGGVGNDIVRGGQDNDAVYGQDGDDWISGDKGVDTLTGGTGADTFHTFAGAGQDRVTDFNRAEGDRIQLLPGATYTVSQVGQDTLIDLGGGDGLLLVGVAASSVASDWFVGV